MPEGAYEKWQFPNAYVAIDESKYQFFIPTVVRQNIIRDFIVYSSWLLWLMIIYFDVGYKGGVKKVFSVTSRFAGL